MNLERIDYWIGELQGFPEFQANKAADAKLRWLNEHIVEYIQRWSGFASIDRISIEATLASDLYFLIVAAVQLVDKLVQSNALTTQFPHFEWGRFVREIEFIREHPRKEHIETIANAFQAYLATGHISRLQN